MKLDVFQCDLCKKEHRQERRAKVSVNWSCLKYDDWRSFIDLCESCEAEIKKTIERIKK